METKKIYLAGKIEKNGWRHSIVRNLRIDEFSTEIQVRPLYLNNEYFQYIGPYFYSCDHGCAHKNERICQESDGGHSCHRGKYKRYNEPDEECEGCLYLDKYESPHGVGLTNEGGCIDVIYNGIPSHEQVFQISCKSIQECDILFVWINKDNAYGSFIEIGYAKALNKQIIICTDKIDDDKWFIYQCSNSFQISDNPKDGLIKGLEDLGYMKKEEKKKTYFIKAGNCIKIGKSQNPEKRISELQTGNHEKLELIYASNMDENTLQNKFKQYHKQGEWYFYSKEIQDFIDENDQ